MHNHNDNEPILALPASNGGNSGNNDGYCGDRPECRNCQKVWQFNYTTLTMEHDGIEVGDTVPLVCADELAETLEIHPAALPLHLTLHHLPVYNVGDTVYVDPRSVQFMLQNRNICLADL